MPLRDHFVPPISNHSSWEGFHGMWPATMVQELSKVLPDRFTAEPRVHLGSYFEIDVSTYQDEEPGVTDRASGNGGVATATWAPSQPTLAVDADLNEPYEYEVLVFDQSRGRQLVAAVEIVSPANKDRPENRRAFVVKCAALLQKGVCVSLVDLVTARHFNLYVELLDLIGQSDLNFAPTPPWIYAATCRRQKRSDKSRLECWAYPLVVGQRFPDLPLWLSEDLAVSLDLESSYEAACRVLRIR